jgi:nitrogenase molybdenum-iron protein alpha chain
LSQTLGCLKQLNHKKNYSGPYHGYDGFAIFARDMDLALNSPTWGLIGAPWNKKAEAKATAKATA